MKSQSTRPNRAGSVILILFGLVFFAAGCAAIFWGISNLKSGWASVSWPEAEGKVTASRVEKGTRRTGSGSRGRRKTSYTAKISYDYSVDGSDYSSNRVSFGVNSGSAQEIVNRYSKGKDVTVYYDPEEPELAVLETGTSLFSYIPLGVGLLFGLVGGGIMLAGIFGKGSETESET